PDAVRVRWIDLDSAMILFGISQREFCKSPSRGIETGNQIRVLLAKPNQFALRVALDRDSGAELGPEFGIGDETARFFMRESRPFGDAAKRVIHCPVEAGVERRHLLTGAWKLMRRCILRRAHRDFDEEIALDGVPAFLEVKLSLSGNRLDKLIRQKDLLAPKLKQSSR